MVTLTPNDIAMLIFTIALIALPSIGVLYRKIIYDFFVRRIMRMTRVRAYQLSKKDPIGVICQIPWIVLGIIFLLVMPKRMREDIEFLTEKASDETLEKLRLEDYQEARNKKK